MAVGSGTPIQPPTELGDEPWKMGLGATHFVPAQAEVGDYALFFKKAAVEITFEKKNYLIVPNSAVLVLVREGFEAVGGFSEAVYASEEIWFSRQLKRWGRERGLAFEVLDVDPVVTSARKLEWFSPLRMAVHTILCDPGIALGSPVVHGFRV